MSRATSVMPGIVGLASGAATCAFAALVPLPHLFRGSDPALLGTFAAGTYGALLLALPDQMLWTPGERAAQSLFDRYGRRTAQVLRAAELAAKAADRADMLEETAQGFKPELRDQVRSAAAALRNMAGDIESDPAAATGLNTLVARSEMVVEATLNHAKIRRTTRGGDQCNVISTAREDLATVCGSFMAAVEAHTDHTLARLANDLASTAHVADALMGPEHTSRNPKEI